MTLELDFRSDTVTRPTPGMLAAMSLARVGDDVLDDDPTVHELQDRVAALLGKEAAIFMPSGSMSNQIGLRLHCAAGDEFICESGCHIYNYEQATFAQLSGLATRTIDGEYGVLRASLLNGMKRPDSEHCVRTKLLCLENTHNRGSGRVYPYAELVACTDWARANQLATHLDGARLFNAVVASGIQATDWTKHFDTVSICFSKGLGCPIGSALAGPRELIKQARRHRKAFGGAMRQVGFLAAAAIYALDHHIERLAEDHAKAQRLGELVKQLPGVQLRPPQVDTNIVIFQIDPTVATGADVVQRAKAAGLLMLAVAPQMIRLVTHLDVSAEDVERAGEILQQVWQDIGRGTIATNTDSKRVVSVA